MTVSKEELENYYKSNSIHYYMNDGTEHLFVYNDSNKFDATGRRSTIQIPLDASRVIKIDATRLPIDLTEQAPKNEIIESSLFRSLLQKNYVRICKKDEAMSILSDPSNKKEIDKLRENRVLSIDDINGRGDISIKEDESEIKVAEQGVNLTVLDCVNTDMLSMDEKVTTIKNIADILTKGDWEYIYSNSSDELKELAVEYLK